MRAIVRKWGNNASVPIPAAIVESVRLKPGDPVDIREDDGRIVIMPVREHEYDLAGLVPSITDDNQHGEVDFGEPAGKEAL